MDTLSASTSLGDFRGHRLDNSVVEFLGLRYAEPPVGELRFAPPVPVTASEPTAIEASTFGDTPPQEDHDRIHMYGDQGEDVLWLNVWTPAADDEKREVMVWIHGGGWLVESACDTVYSGHVLANRGNVVVVSIEYRTNAFGFTHLSDVPGSGNAGILDQLEALRWVASHIESFGGDPSKVTIFGESAGGMSVSCLLGMPAASGLFQRAIMQSNVASTVRSPGFASSVTERLMEAASEEAGGSITSTADLRSLTWQELRTASTNTSYTMRVLPDTVYGPVVDGEALPEYPIRAVAAGLNAEVPIMLGTTRNEMRYWLELDPRLSDPAFSPRDLIGQAPANTFSESRSVEDVESLYRANFPAGEPPSHIALAAFDDIGFRQPINRMAELAQAPAYVYLFDWAPLVPKHPEFDYGVPHATELGFMLGTHTAYPEFYGNRWSTGLEHQVMDAWIAFARTGSPDHDGLPLWPAYTSTTRPVMKFNADNDGPTSRVELDPESNRREFWADVPFDGSIPSNDPASDN